MFRETQERVDSDFFGQLRAAGESEACAPLLVANNRLIAPLSRSHSSRPNPRGREAVDLAEGRVAAGGNRAVPQRQGS